MKGRWLAMMMAGVMTVSVAGCGGGTGASTTVAETAGEQREAKVSQESVAYAPAKDFNIRVPFAAGGALDTIVRIMGQGLQKNYGKNVMINNLTGANGAIAAADLEEAKADATELMAGGIAMFTLAPLFNKDLNMKLEDFQFVSGLVSEDMVLFVSPKNSGLEDWAGLQEYAKSNRVIYGANAPGGTTHLLATMLFGEAGIDAEAVTSDGSAKDLLALAGGNVVCTVANASLGQQYIDEGTMVPIMVFSEDSYTGFEGISVPTAKSLGYDIVFKTCNFLMTKKDVNPEDVQAIYQSLLVYSETDEFKELASGANYIPDLVDGATVKKTIEEAAAMCQEAYETYYAK